MENKKTKIISIVAIVALTLTIITATYAYFAAQTGDPASADIKINTNTVDTFTFSTGSQISFSLDQESFASGKGNITGSTYASALLTANNKTNTATEHYYLYLKIEKNTFTYSINTNTPEIIMTITDNSGNELDDISTLNHVIVTGANGTKVSGYDITNKNGLITLINNREITTTSSKEEKWNITITFINYDETQNANAEKSMSAKVMIQKESMLLTRYVKSLYTGTQGENGIYYHNSSLTYGAVDNSYRYAGASDTTNNYVCFGSDASTCSEDNLYRIIGVFGENVKLIKATAITSDLLGTNGAYATDTTFKWSNLSSCPSDTTAYAKSSNIIAVAGDLTNGGCNLWKYSDLNTINLNTNFLNNIGTTWSNMIEDTTWKVSGGSQSNVYARHMYTQEIDEATKTYGPSDGTSKIGLMYASDYGFAAEPSAWTTNLSSYSNSSIQSVNWIYSGLVEWTMTPDSLSDLSVFILSSNGNLTFRPSGPQMDAIVRPVLYLKSSVAYAGGFGTKDSPITLTV